MTRMACDEVVDPSTLDSEDDRHQSLFRTRAAALTLIELILSRTEKSEIYRTLPRE